MEYKILEANGVDNENVDGSALNNFIASGENGIIKGVLNECTVYLVDRNTVAMDTGEILIQGFRVKILSAYTVSRSDSGTSTDYQVIARLTLSTDRSVNFDIICRNPSSLRTDSLYRTESGVYEIELIRFTTTLNGVQNLKRIIYPIDMQSVALESANIAKNMASQALQQTEINSDKISRNTKAIENLESQLSSELIIESRQFAYTVPVPARSAPYAEITKFGGMSYVVDDELRHAKPTAFKSVGANKFNPQWLLNTGYDVTITDDGFYGGQCSWFYVAYGQAPAQLPITDFKENTSYTIQFEGYSENLSVATLGFQFYYTDGTSNYSPFITGTTNKKYSVVTDSNKTLQKILMTYSDGDYVRIKNICIIEGDVAEYVPYTEHTLTIPTAVLEKFDGYGKGRVYNFIDWSAKKYHKVYDAVDLGTLDWTLGDMFYATVSNKKQGISNILCAKYENADTPFSQMPDKSVTGNEIYSLIYIKDSAYSDAATFKVAMQGVMLVYELVTPEVTDISDILPDDNLIGVEGGGTIIVENDYGYAVPSEIVYQLMGASGTGGSSLPQYTGEYEVIE